MKRHTGQKALYEAIAKTKAKSRRRGILERLHPAEEKPQEPVVEVEEPKPQVEPVKLQVEPAKSPVVENPVVVKRPPTVAYKPLRSVERPDPPPSPAKTWLRPKAVQLHDGRVEISVPYTVGVTVLLVAILLVLGAFRLGQMDRGAHILGSNMASEAARTPVRPANVNPPAPAMKARQESPSTDAGAAAGGANGSATTMAGQGDHVIVLAEYPRREDLELVRAYYKGHGVTIEVISKAVLREHFAAQGLDASRVGSGDGFMLVTGQYYDNPANAGSDGYAARQRIAELGRGYKAPAGRESFAPNYFGDAYGMKVR